MRKNNGKASQNILSVSIKQRLSMTSRALNDNPHSCTEIFPTTLVREAYPKLPGSGPRGAMIEIANIIRTCKKMVVKLKGQRNVREDQKKREIAEQENMEKLEEHGEELKYARTGTTLLGSI